VDPAPAALAQLLAEQVRPPRLVVDVPDEGVLDADPPPGRLEVAVGRIEGLVDLPAGVDRDEFVAQLVVGGVQRQGERHRDALGGEPVDAGDEPDRRHREPRAEMPRPEGAGSVSRRIAPMAAL
jgi:hypothetical protein